MKRTFTLAVAALCMLFANGVAAQETEEQEDSKPKLQIRNFDHLEFDTVTGTYFGVAAFYTRDDRAVFNGYKTKQEIYTTEIRLLMGGDNVQAGVAIPYHTTDTARFNTTCGGGDDDDGPAGPCKIAGQGDIGKVRAHLKAVPLRTDLFDLGGGLMLTFPSGGGDRTITPSGDLTATTTLPFAPDAVGILPFVTGTAHAGPVDVNAHIGYEFVNHEKGQGRPESILYGGSATLPVLDFLGLRLEIAGQQFTGSQTQNVVAIEPGIDVLVPAGPVNLQLSASGGYGLSGGSAGLKGSYGSLWGLNTYSGLSRGQWGAGLAFGVVFD